jgi:hypothetical protein
MCHSKPSPAAWSGDESQSITAEYSTPVEEGRRIDRTSLRVRQLIAQGKIRAIQTGRGRYLITRSGVERVMAERVVTGTCVAA